MRGQSRGTLRALAGICRCHLRFFFLVSDGNDWNISFLKHSRNSSVCALAQYTDFAAESSFVSVQGVPPSLRAQEAIWETCFLNLFPESSVDRDAGAGGVGVGRFWDWECWDVRNEMAGLHLYISHYRHFNDCAPTTLSIAWTLNTSLFPSQVIFSVLVPAARQAN